MACNVTFKRLTAIFFTLLLSFAPTSAGFAAQSGPVLEVTPLYGSAALKPGEKTILEILITIKAPEVERKEKRPPVAVSLVLDRSGSMGEARKLDYAKKAAKILVESLEKDDLFSLVVYDRDVQALYPLNNVSAKDKEGLLNAIEQLRPGSTTFLSGGLEEGIKQLQKVKNEGPTRVILLSDGLANVGVTNVEQIAAIGAKARSGGIGVSSIGLGLDFDEDIMQLLAQRGGGQYYYIADSEFLPGVFEDELALVVNSFTKDLGISYTTAPDVTPVKVYGYTTTRSGKNTNIEFSDMGAGQERQLMLQLEVVPGKKSGRQDLGLLTLNYNDPEDGKPQKIDVPLALEVVSDHKQLARLEAERGDSVKLVREEALLRKADEEHLLAMKELEEGKVEAARSRLQAQQGIMAAAPQSDAVARKMERMQVDEQNLDMASRDAQMQKNMVKSSKAASYNSAKGSKKDNMLQKGDSGAEVRRLQSALKGSDLYNGDIDGKFGPELEEAVKAYQKSKSMTADGVVGPATMNSLGM